MAYERTLPYNDLPDLPPAGFVESNEIFKHLVKAARHLGQLSGLCASLPDPQLLINTIVLQESKNSSAIENIIRLTYKKANFLLIAGNWLKKW